jgi:hypothetical protein
MSRPGGAVRVWETAASALLVALAVVLSATGSAGAPASGVAVDPAYGPPLTNVKVSGTGFCRTGCSAVSISVGSLFVASDVAVQADGTFSTIMRMPGTVRPGDVTITASQTDQSGATASARTTFSVTTGSPAPTQYPAPTTIQPPTGSPPTARPPQNVTQPAATGGSTTLAGQPGQPGQPSSSPATTADQAGSGTTTSVSSTTGGRALSATPVRHRRPDHTALFVLLTFILLAATAGGGGWWYHRRHTAVP